MEITNQNKSSQLNDTNNNNINENNTNNTNENNIIDNIGDTFSDIGKDVLGDEFIDFISKKKKLTEKEIFMNKVNNFFNNEKNYKKNQYYIYDSKTKSNFFHLIAFQLYNVKINFIFILCLIIGITCGFSIWYFKKEFGTSIFIGFIITLILILFQAIFIYKWEIRNIFQFYLQKFIYNINYITTCSSKWDEIINLFNKIKKVEPTFNPPSLQQDKPIYDKQIFIYSLYLIMCMLIIVLGYIIYYISSYGFNYIINMFSNTSYYLKIRTYSFLFICIFLILLYYIGISLLINLFISITKILVLIIVYTFVAIEYLFLAIIFIIKNIFNIFSTSSQDPTKTSTNSQNQTNTSTNSQNQTNTSTNSQDQTKTSTNYQDRSNTDKNIRSDSIKKVDSSNTVDLDDIPSSSTFGNITKASILYMNKCKNMSKIEKLFVKYNKPRDTTKSRSFVNKLVKSESMPNFIKNNNLLKCLTKEEPKKKTKKLLKCPSDIID